MQLYILITILIHYTALLSANKVVKFTAVLFSSQPLPQRSTLTQFYRWFRDEQSMDKILKCNPGLNSIEKLEGTRYIGSISPLHFPGVTVKSRMTFDCMRNEQNAIIVRCLEDSMQQEYEGNKLFASWLEKLLPTVTSSTEFGVDEEQLILFNNSTLQIAFALPRWFPVPADIIEQKGSVIIRDNMKRDMDKVISNIIDLYEREELEDL